MKSSLFNLSSWFPQALQAADPRKFLNLYGYFLIGSLVASTWALSTGSRLLHAVLIAVVGCLTGVLAELYQIRSEGTSLPKVGVALVAVTPIFQLFAAKWFAIAIAFHLVVLYMGGIMNTKDGGES